MKTTLTVDVVGRDLLHKTELPGLGPVGDNAALEMLCATALAHLRTKVIDLRGDDVVALVYEYTDDGDPPLRACRLLTFEEVLLTYQGRPIQILESRAAHEGGPYDGWLKCARGWLMDPEATGE